MVDDTLRQMDTVILHHSLDVFPRDREDQSSMVSEFHGYLVKLCQQQMNRMHWKILLNKVLVGVYKRRGHAVKYLVSLEGNQTIRQSDLQLLPEWGDSAGLLKELLSSGECERCGEGEVVGGDRGVAGDAESGGGVAGDRRGVTGDRARSGEGVAGGGARSEGGTGGGARSGTESGGAGGVAHDVVRRESGGGAHKGQMDSEIGSRGIEGGEEQADHRASIDMQPLELAAKLGLMDAMSLLAEAGMRVCPSSDPLLCSSALHLATINQDLGAMQRILQLVQTEWATDALLSQQLCDLLTLSKCTFGRSPLDIAHFQCSSGLSCRTLTYLLPWVWSSCTGKGYSFPVFPYGHLLCPVLYHDLISPHCVSQKDRWSRCIEEGRWCNFEAPSGYWRVYGDHSVGRTDCALIHVSAESVTPTQFERDFVDMRLVNRDMEPLI